MPGFTMSTSNCAERSCTNLVLPARSVAFESVTLTSKISISVSDIVQLYLYIVELFHSPTQLANALTAGAKETSGDIDWFIAASYVKFACHKALSSTSESTTSV